MPEIATYFVEENLLPNPNDPNAGSAGQADECGNISAIEDHAADGLAQLIIQYQCSPRLQAFIGCFLNVLNDADAAIVDLIQNVLSLENAGTAQLDIIGSIIGLPRPFRLNDDNYRRRLGVELAIQRSDGKIEDIIAVIRALTQLDSLKPWVQIVEYFPHYILICLNLNALDPVTFRTYAGSGGKPINGDIFRESVQRALPASTILNIITGSDASFCFSTTDTPEAATDGTFTDNDYNNSGTGGFADLL